MGDMQQGFRQKDGRLAGLGQTPNQLASCSRTKDCPNGDPIGELLKCGFSNVPIVEYTTWTVNLPILDTEISETFGETVNILQSGTQAPAGVVAADSSFVQGGLLQVDMIVSGLGIHAFGEPISFSVNGNSMPRSGNTQPIMSPTEFTSHDLANNAMGLTTGVVPATLTWGQCDQEALWHFANAYQMQWLVNQRTIVMQEMVSDVCFFGPYAEAAAASSSEEAIQPYVRRVNNQYASKGSANAFVPINARRTGSVNTNPGAATTGVGVFHPTRDYDTVGATFGGTRNQGNSGASPFRRFPRPVLLEKGLPIGITLRATNGYHLTQFQRLLSISEGQGGTSAQVAIDAAISGLTLTGVANTFLELTLDPITPANVFQNQTVQTDRMIYKGGALKFAVLIKGVELWGPWKDFIQKSCDCRINMPSGNMNGLPSPTR